MSLYRSRGCGLALAAVLLLFSVSSLPAQGVDDRDSQEDASAGFSVEKLDTSVRFAADGTSTRERSAVIRLQSDAAVRSLGVLSFSYTSDNEQLEIDYVRVRKADGRVIDTPASSVQEAPSPVTTAAPMYSDLRIKQIPVRALANGDLLEYKLRWVGTKSLVPGQFWFADDFEKDVEVKAETLTIRVPADKYVKLSSPEVQPQTHDEGGEKVYSWTTSHPLDDKKADDEKKAKDSKPKSDDAERHSVELTTFKSWEEIGRWYSALATDRVAVTPEVQAKADELTKGLTSTDAKEHAIYDYVATKYRYISISFGEGRYQPHSASEVMANLYGDCKDKHTLLTALMKAAGIQVSTVLIGDGLPFNADVPSPAQFNHVIGVIPGAKDIWLDTTTEVAPFGQIVGDLRGHQALLIPPSGAPKIVTTPKEPAVPETETVQFKGALDGDGTLTGHLDITVGGDAEVIIRSAFHETSPTQWSDLAQSMSTGMGYGGKVSAVDIDSPLDTSHRFHFGWDYKREKYGDWADLRIPPPVPMELLPEPADDQKDDLQVGTADTELTGELKLPAAYSIAIPSAAHVSNSVGEYDESYAVTDGILKWKRAVILRKDKIQTADRADYAQITSAANAGAQYMIGLTKSGGAGAVEVTEDNPRAQELLRQAMTAMQSRQMSQAGDALKQAELLNPKQAGLWAMYAGYYGMSGQTQKALESLHKELEIHPGETEIWKTLGEAEFSLHHQAEAETAYRKYHELVPDDAQASMRLAGLLSSDKTFGDAIAVLESAIKLAPDNVDLAVARTTTLLQSDRKQDGVTAAKELQVKIATDAGALNDVGYTLVDNGADLKLGLAMVEKSVSLTEELLKGTQLSDVTSDQLKQISSLGLAWDSEGWAYYLNGDVNKAERLVEASWKLLQHGGVGDHLGQIYEKLGRKDDAIHLYKLAMTAGNAPKETEERLKALEGPAAETTIEKKGNTTVYKLAPVLPIEELGKLRTVNVPEFTQTKGAGEFFVLLSAKGPEDVRFLSGPDEMRGAKDAILHAKFDTPFGDDGPEKIARRGVLSCSAYTKPNCQFVLLLPSNTTAP